MQPKMSEVQEFSHTPLMIWFSSCVMNKNELITLKELVNGTFLHNLFLKIDPQPLYEKLPPAYSNIQRIWNLNKIIANINKYYNDDLGYLVRKLPNPYNLVLYPECHIEDTKLLLLLLLGCAIECPNKKLFIKNIQTLNEVVQMSIMNYINQIIETHDIVIREVYLNDNSLFNLLYQNTNEKHIIHSDKKLETYKNDKEDNCEFDNKLFEAKSKIRTLQYRLDEISDELIECKTELDKNIILLDKSTEKNNKLLLEIKNVNVLRDDLDSANERAERVPFLETQIVRYKEHLSTLEFHKVQNKELQEMNESLRKRNKILTDELETISNISNRKSSFTSSVETKIMEYKTIINDMKLQISELKEKYEPCSEQLDNSLQRKVSKFEQKNNKLMLFNELLKETSTCKCERLVEIENENRVLSSKINTQNSLTLTVNVLNNNINSDTISKVAVSDIHKRQQFSEQQQNNLQSVTKEFHQTSEKIEKIQKEADKILSLYFLLIRELDEKETALEAALESAQVMEFH